MTGGGSTGSSSKRDPGGLSTAGGGGGAGSRSSVGSWESGKSQSSAGSEGKGGALPNPVSSLTLLLIHLLQLHWHPAIVNMTVKGSQDWGKEGNMYFGGQQIPLLSDLYCNNTQTFFESLNYLVCTKHNTPELLL